LYCSNYIEARVYRPLTCIDGPSLCKNRGVQSIGADFRFEVPGQSSVGLIGGGRGQWLKGHHGECRARAYNGGLGRRAVGCSVTGRSLSLHLWTERRSSKYECRPFASPPRTPAPGNLTSTSYSGVQGSGGRSPPEAESILDVQRSRQI